MNTVQKGDKLEDRIFDLFTQEIENDRFFAKKECCKVFKKKGYYSKDREKDIIFDVSIEISLPGQETYSSLVLIECKNYNHKHKVPVDDVEEFYQKTQQVSGGNVKGIVVSTSSFQESAFKFSKSKGFGLARYSWGESLSWVLTRSPSSFKYVNSESSHTVAYQGLRADKVSKGLYDFLGTTGDKYSTSLNEFFIALFSDENNEIGPALNKQNKKAQKPQQIVEFVAEEDIEDLTERVLSDIKYLGGPVELPNIGEYLSDSVGLELRLNEKLTDNVLGTIQFDPLVICIDSDKASEIQRIRFTLAHEFGHYFLGHSKHVLSESCFDSVVDQINVGELGFKDVARMEWQANKFASSLLLPRRLVVDEFMRLAEKNGLTDRGHGYLYLDNQKCNIDNYYCVTSSLMKKFKVSRQVVKYRLVGLGLLKDHSLTGKSSRHLAARLI